MIDTAEPRWLKALREQSATKSQKKLGAEIGYSPAVVNQVLGGKYKGDTAKVEQAVRGAYMGETVSCPILGELAINKCQENQRTPFVSSNPRRVALFRACRNGCRHSTLNP